MAAVLSPVERRKEAQLASFFLDTFPTESASSTLEEVKKERNWPEIQINEY